MVKDIRKRMSRIGCIKLYDLLKPKFNELGIKCGRDKLFTILRDARMLVPKKKKFTRTTQSNHLFNKHSNQVKGLSPIPQHSATTLALPRFAIQYIKIKDPPVYLFAEQGKWLVEGPSKWANSYSEHLLKYSLVYLLHKLLIWTIRQ